MLSAERKHASGCNLLSACKPLMTSLRSREVSEEGMCEQRPGGACGWREKHTPRPGGCNELGVHESAGSKSGRVGDEVREVRAWGAK